MRWGTDDADIREDNDTYQTSFNILAKLCETKELNVLDVFGIALTAANEKVKHERMFNEGKRENPFDYNEGDELLMYTETEAL